MVSSGWHRASAGGILVVRVWPDVPVPVPGAARRRVKYNKNMRQFGVAHNICNPFHER